MNEELYKECESIVEKIEQGNLQEKRVWKKCLVDKLLEHSKTVEDLVAYRQRSIYECCDAPSVSTIKNSESKRTSDGTLLSYPAVKWCSNCGSLYQGDSLIKPTKASL